MSHPSEPPVQTLSAYQLVLDCHDGEQKRMQVVTREWLELDSSVGEVPDEEENYQVEQGPGQRL